MNCSMASDGHRSRKIGASKRDTRRYIPPRAFDKVRSIPAHCRRALYCSFSAPLGIRRSAEGGQPDHKAPTGLHAYTNGALPTGIVQVGIQGSATTVHQLSWRWNDSTQTKGSTMFPNWMPPEHVRTLIALKYPDTCANAVEPSHLFPTDARTYIQHGHEVKLTQKGDTVYPTT